MQGVKSARILEVTKRGKPVTAVNLAIMVNILNGAESNRKGMNEMDNNNLHENFMAALSGCDTVSVISTGCGEQVFAAKEVYESMESLEKEIASLKSELAALDQVTINLDNWHHQAKSEHDRADGLQSELAALKERDGWIPISEWLPGIKQEVLCTHQKDKWVSTGYRKNKWQWYDTHDQCCEIIVTHWMPLPNAIEKDK